VKKRVITFFLKPLVLLMCVIMSMDMAAAGIDAAGARTRALQFLNSQQRNILSANPQQLSLVHTEKSKADARLADYYVFNADDGSAFVIVAGDDRAAGVLACGNHAIDMDDVPCNMQWLLDHYSEQMDYLRAHPEVPVMAAAGQNSVVVSPLVSCTWNQRAPFYNQCPTSGTQHCLTGCVATAMAQVMYYWKYPAQAPALDGYTSEVNGATVDALPGGTFDWDNMLDVYPTNATARQKDAVAMLMRYCGQACHMGYGTSASGAYSDDELEGMKTFGYNNDAVLLDRDDFTAVEWAAMIEQQLAAGCPILYGGVDADKNAGHAFVVDGCGGGMYHINWGWSGSGDGYFVLDAFTTMNLQYSSEQQMLYQVYPAGYLYDKHAALLLPATQVGATSFTATWTDSTPSEWVTGYTLYVQPYDPSAHEVVLNETFAAINVNLDATTALSANKVGDYCDNPGWTGSFVYLGAGGCFIVGGQKYVGSLTTPQLYSDDDGKITVRFTARYYGNENSSALVTCGDTQLCIPLTRMATPYALVFDNVAPGAKVTFGCTGRAQRFYLDDVVVTTGDDRDPVEMSPDGTGFLVVPDLTAMTHNVTGLTTGATYRFLAVTRFADQVSKKSNVQLVTLLDQEQHNYRVGDVNHDSAVDIDDVTLLISCLLNGWDDNICSTCANVDGAGGIDIDDVTSLIGIVLGMSVQ
jgi:hypothetical protein